MEHFLVNWGYTALFVATFVASMGIPVGSEIALAYGGVLASGSVASAGHHFSLAGVILVALAGEVAGSMAGYGIGYFGGRTLVDRVGKYILLSHQDLDRAEGWFDRHGGIAAFVGRLIPLARSFISFAAGLAEMRVLAFFVATTAASAIFVATLVSIGYSLGSSWQSAVHKFNVVGYVAAALIVLAIVLAFAHRIRQVRGHSRVHGAHSPAARQQASRQQAGGSQASDVGYEGKPGQPG